jgi:hypothetical protein
MKSETVNYLPGFATRFGSFKLFYECDSFESGGSKQSCGQWFYDISTLDRLLKLEELQRFADHRLLIIQGKLQRIRERN